MPKILIVEDDPTISDALALVLSREGFEVTQTVDGRHGLEAATKNPPDLILLDMLMPNMSGLDFLTAFKPSEHPEIHIIVVSNMGADSTFKRAAELGVKRFLTKSEYTPKEILAVVQSELAAGDKPH